MMKNTPLALTLYLALGATSAQAGLIGDSVSGILSGGNTGWVLTSQFTSPAIVGAGVEFSGGFSAPFSPWVISVDVFDTGFSVLVNSATAGPVGCLNFCIGVDLSDLDWAGATTGITGVSLVSGNAGAIDSLTFGVNSTSVRFQGLRTGLYQFSLTADDAQVPAPATLALFGLGLAGLGWSRRKKA